MKKEDPIVVCAACRTLLGAFMGVFASSCMVQLGATAIHAALLDAGKTDVDEVIMGCVLSAGLGQAPARQAARAANLPDNVGATMGKKVCSSGMKAIMLAHDQLAAGAADVIVGGGIESISRAPFLLQEMRAGRQMGLGKLLEHLTHDGLEDPS